MYTPTNQAKLFSETWHLEMINRDIEQKESELNQLKEAKLKCEEIIADLVNLCKKEDNK